jgi:hypothetical protein
LFPLWCWYLQGDDVSRHTFATRQTRLKNAFGQKENKSIIPFTLTTTLLAWLGMSLPMQML